MYSQQLVGAILLRLVVVVVVVAAVVVVMVVVADNLKYKEPVFNGQTMAAIAYTS